MDIVLGGTRTTHSSKSTLLLLLVLNQPWTPKAKRNCWWKWQGRKWNIQPSSCNWNRKEIEG